MRAAMAILQISPKSRDLSKSKSFLRRLRWTLLTLYVRRYLDFSQQRRFEELWYQRDYGVGYDFTGTQQLLDFALAVYDKLLGIEESINRSNQFQRGIAGLKVLVRIDIGLIWDNTSPDSAQHRYRFIVNEIQPGECGLFMIDADARTSIPRAVLQGILRGSFDQ